MVPDPLAKIDGQLKQLTQTLYHVLIQAYDFHPPPTQEVSGGGGGGGASTTPTTQARSALTHSLAQLAQQLAATSTTATTPGGPITDDDDNNLSPLTTTTTTTTAAAAAATPLAPPLGGISLPPEVIQYVDDGRNPDIYTREFVELTQSNNQLLRGRAAAFARFADLLAAEMARANPAAAPDLERVMRRRDDAWPEARAVGEAYVRNAASSVPVPGSGGGGVGVMAMGGGEGGAAAGDAAAAPGEMPASIGVEMAL